MHSLHVCIQLTFAAIETAEKNCVGIFDMSSITLRPSSWPLLTYSKVTSAAFPAPATNLEEKKKNVELQIYPHKHLLKALANISQGGGTVISLCVAAVSRMSVFSSLLHLWISCFVVVSIERDWDLCCGYCGMLTTSDDIVLPLIWTTPNQGTYRPFFVGGVSIGHAYFRAAKIAKYSKL